MVHMGKLGIEFSPCSLGLCYKGPAMLNERRLWVAVLDLALEDLGNTERGKRARAWLTSDRYGPGSFLWICDNLELDASSIRRRVFEIAQGLTASPAV